MILQMHVLALLLFWPPSSGEPIFVERMSNLTVTTGREAVFTCVVDNADHFKVAFLRVDTQTILTIDETVITRSSRVAVRHTIDQDSTDSQRVRKTWQMTLKEVSPSDAAAYMCQLNTEPMISQLAFLRVTVPPDILVNESSSDLTLSEGQNATLRCNAIGFPQPNITWRREDYQPISLKKSVVVDGSTLDLVNVNRQEMAAYLCIASNGVPPPVSKRIMVKINFPPNVTTHQVDVQQRLGEKLLLHCQCHSWPPGITYWSHQTDRLPSENNAIQYHHRVEGAVTDTYLTINEMLPQDQGNYTCYCSNIYGKAKQTINVFGIVQILQRRKVKIGGEEELVEITTTSAAPTVTTTTVIPPAARTTLEAKRTTTKPLQPQQHHQESGKKNPVSWKNASATPVADFLFVTITGFVIVALSIEP